MTDKKWSHSRVVFHGGESYTVGNQRFKRGMPRTVTSLNLRRKLNGVAGFTIDDFYVTPEAGDTSRPDVSKPPKPPKSKKKVKRVAKGNEK